MTSSTEKIIAAVLENDASVTNEQRTAGLAVLSGRLPHPLPAFLLHRLQEGTTGGRPVDEKPAKRYLRRHAAAEYLGCSVRQVDAFKHNGDLPFVRLGRRLIVFRVEDLDRVMTDRRISAEEPDGE